MASFTLTGNLVDVHQKKIYAAEITVEEGRITKIIPITGLLTPTYILPGFIDAHIHIES